MNGVALLGLGRMGTAIGHRLLDAGVGLTVWNRTEAAAAPLAERGAAVAATPAVAAGSAEVAITMPAGPDALAAVMDEVMPALRPNALLIDMSTVGPAAVHALAARLPDGASLVDAPVAGSVDRARTGALTVFAGGDPGAVATASTVLEHLGTVVACGPGGTGAALKLVVNAGMIASMAVLADVLRLADASGLPSATVLDTLASGPLAGAVARSRASNADFPITHAAKDLALATAVDSAGTPVLDAASRALAAVASGDLGGRDLRHLVTVH